MLTRRRNPLRTALTAYAMVAFLLMVAALARLLLVLLAAGVLGCIGWGCHRARRGASRPSLAAWQPMPVMASNVARLQAEATRLLAANDQSGTICAASSQQRKNRRWPPGTRPVTGHRALLSSHPALTVVARWPRTAASGH